MLDGVGEVDAGLTGSLLRDPHDDGGDITVLVLLLLAEIIVGELRRHLGG